jgi:TRAP-type mannitol/chloroaromatic compound transport system permease small subunit
VKVLLKFSRAIDKINEICGRGFMLLILVAVVVSASNAIARKVLNIGSNAFLEIQWYLFGAVFLMCAGYALRHNDHVRIDVVFGKLSRRGQAWVDIAGTLLFLLPLCAIVIYHGWPRFVDAFVSGERSMDAGGLIRWPIWLMIPVGFGLLALQGISELIKRIAYLQGRIPFPIETKKSGEEELIQAIKAGHPEAKK